MIQHVEPLGGIGMIEAPANLVTLRRQMPVDPQHILAGAADLGVVVVQDGQQSCWPKRLSHRPARPPVERRDALRVPGSFSRTATSSRSSMPGRTANRVVRHTVRRWFIAQRDFHQVAAGVQHFLGVVGSIQGERTQIQAGGVNLRIGRLRRFLDQSVAGEAVNASLRGLAAVGVKTTTLATVSNTTTRPAGLKPPNPFAICLASAAA